MSRGRDRTVVSLRPVIGLAVLLATSSLAAAPAETQAWRTPPARDATADATAPVVAGADLAVSTDDISLRTQQKGVRSSTFGPGPIVIVRRVRARETFSFQVDARPDEVLRVAAIGDGDTNIDLVLRDRDGAVLCSDSSMDHYPVCTLVRPRGGPVRIEVVNRGSVWSRVQILTN